ncbi:MAG: multiheme c-type cytochrome, partial [Phycisphaerae bacterium]
MDVRVTLRWTGVFFLLSPAWMVQGAGPAALPRLSEQSKACIACHKQTDRGIFEQWGGSLHYRANVGCYECHRAAKGEPDAFEHFDETIAVIVSPADCAKCHTREAAEFRASHHSKAGRILGSLDNVLAEVIEGN